MSCPEQSVSNRFYTISREMPRIARNSGEDIGVLVWLHTAMENTHEIMTDEELF